jgi:hypothetical protein
MILASQHLAEIVTNAATAAIHSPEAGDSNSEAGKDLSGLEIFQETQLNHARSI